MPRKRSKWHRIKRFLQKPIISYHAREISKQFEEIHDKVLSTLEGNLSLCEKERQIVLPLKKLSNRSKLSLPIIHPLIEQYRIIATDLYPVHGEERDIEVVILKLRCIWEKTHKKLAKLSRVTIFDILIHVIIRVISKK